MHIFDNLVQTGKRWESCSLYHARVQEFIKINKNITGGISMVGKMNHGKQDEFLTYILEDVLGDISDITSRAMFGGYDIYKDGIIFALIAYDQLYFKVGESNRADYEAMDSEPFVYQQGKHKKTTMSYWYVPEEVMQDKDRIKEWVDKSVAVSRASKKDKR